MLGLGLLRRFSPFPECGSSFRLILLSLAFGDTLFYYALNEPSMSCLFLCNQQPGSTSGQQYARKVPTDPACFNLPSYSDCDRHSSVKRNGALPFPSSRAKRLAQHHEFAEKPTMAVGLLRFDRLGWMLFQVLLNRPIRV